MNSCRALCLGRSFSIVAVLSANCKVSIKKLHHRKVMQLIWFYIAFTSCGTNRRHHRCRRRSLGLLRRARRRGKSAAAGCA